MPRLSDLLAQLHRDVVELRVPADEQERNDEAPDEVGHVGHRPEPHELPDRPLAGDDGGHRHQEVLGEELRATQEQGEEPNREGQTAEQLRARLILNEHERQHTEADVEAGHEPGRHQIRRRASQPVEPFLDGLVEEVEQFPLDALFTRLRNRRPGGTRRRHITISRQAAHDSRHPPAYLWRRRQRRQQPCLQRVDQRTERRTEPRSTWLHMK